MGQCIFKSDSKWLQAWVRRKIIWLPQYFHDRTASAESSSAIVRFCCCSNSNGYTVDHLKWTRMHSSSRSITRNRTFDLFVCVCLFSSVSKAKTMIIIRIFIHGFGVCVCVSTKHKDSTSFTFNISAMYLIVEFIQRKAHTALVEWHRAC